MNWYKQLTIHQKITFKELYEDLCGVKFDEIGKILSFRQRIDIGCDKIKTVSLVKLKKMSYIKVKSGTYTRNTVK